MVRSLLRSLSVSAMILAVASGWAADTTITLFHVNDTHGHLEPSRVRNVSVGGFARLSTLLQREKATAKNPVLLHAGDVFQGTLYFNIYEGLADVVLLNKMGFQAMAVGNHEFDKGPAPLAAFIKNSNFPSIAANLDLSREPSLKDVVKPSAVIMAGGEKVGIVGAITDTLMTISSPGPTVGLKPLVASVQAAVDDLTKQGINKIVLLSHCGYQEDIQLARRLKDVDVIVGGHSHSLLGQIELPGFDGTRGPYPTISQSQRGPVLIVQAWEWGKVLGRLELTFDAQGKVKSHQGRPILVSESIPEDPAIVQLLNAFRKPMEALITQPAGELAVDLPRSPTGSSLEGLLGNVIADSMLAQTENLGAVVAFMNQGGVRASLEKGKVTYGQLIEVQPFNNTLVLLEVSGAELMNSLEHAVRGDRPILLPSREFSMTINPSAPVGNRVVSATIKGQPIDSAKTYKICLNSFVAGGGDGFEAFKNAKGIRTDTGFLDIDALVDFVKKNSPVNAKVEGRIKRAQ